MFTMFIIIIIFMFIIAITSIIITIDLFFIWFIVAVIFIFDIMFAMIFAFLFIQDICVRLHTRVYVRIKDIRRCVYVDIYVHACLCAHAFLYIF